MISKKNRLLGKVGGWRACSKEKNQGNCDNRFPECYWKDGRCLTTPTSPHPGSKPWRERGGNKITSKQKQKNNRSSLLISKKRRNANRITN
jgi:hypothetical protein